MSVLKMNHVFVTIDDILPLDDILAVCLQVAAVHSHTPRVSLELLALELELLQHRSVVNVS